MKTIILVTGMTLLALAATGVGAGGATVDYPAGYRDWHHVKSMVIQAGHPLENPFGGIHHVYANKKALAGLKSGRYPDGAVLVFDLLTAQEGDSAIAEGQRKLVGVMQRDARRFKGTGGWGFEGFSGNSRTERLTSDGGVSCFECHAPKQKTEYVFSTLRD